MSWKTEWSRHYDQIQWTATTILTGIVGALLAYAYSIPQIDPFMVWIGCALTWLTVYYAASFRQLRSALHSVRNPASPGESEVGEELVFLSRLPHRLKQWPAFIAAFALFSVAWCLLFRKHGFHGHALCSGITSFVVLVVLSILGAQEPPVECSPGVRPPNRPPA